MTQERFLRNGLLHRTGQINLNISQKYFHLKTFEIYIIFTTQTPLWTGSTHPTHFYRSSKTSHILFSVCIHFLFFHFFHQNKFDSSSHLNKFHLSKTAPFCKKDLSIKLHEYSRVIIFIC